MKARFMIENPDHVLTTLKVTMTVGEWVTLRDQLASAYPSWRLSSAISDLVTQARRVFYEEAESAT